MLDLDAAEMVLLQQQEPMKQGVLSVTMVIVTCVMQQNMVAVQMV